MYILPASVQKNTGLALPINDSIKPIYIDGRKNPREIYANISSELEKYNTTIYFVSSNIHFSSKIINQNISFL